MNLLCCKKGVRPKKEGHRKRRGPKEENRKRREPKKKRTENEENRKKRTKKEEDQKISEGPFCECLLFLFLVTENSLLISS